MSDYERALAATPVTEPDSGEGALDVDAMDDLDSAASEDATRAFARAAGLDTSKIDIPKLREALRTIIQLEA